MSSRFDLIAQQLFQKNFEQCTAQELDLYAEAHPFLAPAHFLLVKKLQQEQDASFKIKAQKAALYYYQPIAFEAFLLAEEPLFAAPALQTSKADLQEEFRSEEQPETTTINKVPAATTPANDLIEAQQKEAAPVLELEPEIPFTAGATKESGEPQIKMPALPRIDTTAAFSDALTFEPYHTVDYFASQGIKLSQEELPKDKFGKQLMSFTAWLKTMKKLPAAEGAKSMDPQAEEKVEHLAAHSVNSPEVVTETMAEVWLKQGQPQKAAEVYRKLSLLYPSKKVYFAAKLQNLKQ